MSLSDRWRAFIDSQHRLPSGLVGRLVGERMVHQHAPETAWTLELLAIRPEDRVLELGFGAGRALALAAGRAQQGAVFGVDRSATMVRSAAARNRTALHAGRLGLVQADLHALPLGGARFDKIWSIHTFYFWQAPERLCAELVRMLAPGGALAVTLATARRGPSGDWDYWPVHQRASEVVATLNRLGAGVAELRTGPDSRQFNNVAIVVRV
ncbi:MAG TPA: methyltransferase domain-containing protein [Roseiflexaceae bacterium]|nr:methyltransferase domain-containing protein [Roseiflexaceae bacterium]